MGTIAENYKRILGKINNAAVRSGRNAGDVTLVSVSKTFPVGKIHEAIEAGAGIFGENYIQEAVEKIDAVGSSVEWHFIGHLQTNKVKYASGKFSMIQSVDSLKLLNEINKRAAAKNVKEKILFEVNVSGEESKFGFTPDTLKDSLGEIEVFRNVMPLGLMTIPPYSDNQEDSRKYFVRLRELLEHINAMKIPGINFSQLSMGMSGDFEVAIEEGATIVRVGTAIFGDRG